MKQETVYCACGCGQTFNKYDKRSRIRKFLPSHWSKTQSKIFIVVFCFNCNKRLERKPSHYEKVKEHFCSRKCEGEYATKTGKRRGENNGHYNTITIPCNGCARPVSKARSLIKRRNNQVYCKDCVSLTRQGRKGFYVGYPKEFSPSLRHRIRKRDNFICQECNRIQSETGTLHIHHIDYNKFNNNPTNLLALCRVCHGQTNFATEVWQEKFETLMTHREVQR